VIDPSVLWPWIRDEIATATGRPVFLGGDTQGAPDLPYIIVTPAFAAFDEATLMLRTPTYGVVAQIQTVGRNHADVGAALHAADTALRALTPPVELGVADFLVEAATAPGEGDSEEHLSMAQLFRVLATETAA
jgi:hypothetical protein